MRFAHISDIHVGKSWMFIPELLDKAIHAINGSEVDGVLLTGDLTDWGLESEYDMAKDFLGKIEKELYIVPGNHDARIAGYKMFERTFCQERGRFFSKAFDDVLLLGLDSAEPDIDDGHVGREQLTWLDKELTANDGKKVPLVMLHHHLVPIPYTGRERNILVDAGDVLEVLNGHDVPLVITGHKHNPWTWRLNKMIIYSGGTVSCKRTAVSNAFSFIEIGKGGIRIERRDIPKGEERVIVDDKWD